MEKLNEIKLFLNEHKFYVLVALAILILLLGGGFLYFLNIKETNSLDSKIELEKENTKDEKLEEETPSQECTVMVDVKGQVNQPGLYQLSCNSRVQDAILASGGALESADTSVLNLSKVLEDEMVIIVYSKEEVKSFSYIKEEVKKKEEKCEIKLLLKIMPALLLKRLWLKIILLVVVLILILKYH